MNEYGFRAVAALCVTAAAVTAIIVTGTLWPLWLLLGLLMVVF